MFKHDRLDITLPTPADIGLYPELKMSIKNRKLKPEMETGSGNSFQTERAGEAIPTATLTFATMPDLLPHC